MTASKASGTHIDTLVTISLFLIFYIRVKYIVWSLRIDDFFKPKNIIANQKKEAVMFLFLPTVIYMARQTDDFSTMSLHAIINISIFATIAVYEFFRRIKY
jgi:hypothetical protein